MPKIDHDTKQKILVAAEKVFHQNGFKGTRTAMIAEEAGISRTMMHYYFSTKEALFEAVLNSTLASVFAHFKRLNAETKSLHDFIKDLVGVISAVLEEKPHLPSFIVNILNEAPQLFILMPIVQEDNLPALLDRLLETAKAKGEVSDRIDAENLALDIYGLCALNYLVSPYVQMKENRTETQMIQFNRARKEHILEFVFKGIKP
ncbi:MAG TPA: TetR family transcriptional regulator [Saprospiraceae bacterium]|nr:TetR family transcriptional regulator [Saprospiraceae bacterium]HMQ81709.1 TetR family transcriptional regulator [Saprospiraceae bacterium]